MLSVNMCDRCHNIDYVCTIIINATIKHYQTWIAVVSISLNEKQFIHKSLFSQFNDQSEKIQFVCM